MADLGRTWPTDNGQITRQTTLGPPHTRSALVTAFVGGVTLIDMQIMRFVWPEAAVCEDRGQGSSLGGPSRKEAGEGGGSVCCEMMGSKRLRRMVNSWLSPITATIGIRE